jgi:putative dimethyl sulfoxide reductase chaperone
MSKPINISVPDDLYKRVKRNKQIQISSVCQTALLEAVEGEKTKTTRSEPVHVEADQLGTLLEKIVECIDRLSRREDLNFEQTSLYKKKEEEQGGALRFDAQAAERKEKYPIYGDKLQRSTESLIDYQSLQNLAMEEEHEITHKYDPMLAMFGETGSLENLKEERVSLNLARGRVYEILSLAFSYPWKRKFFRPKSLLEPVDIVMLNEEEWSQLKSTISGFSNYLPNMTIKQIQDEYDRLFGTADPIECPPFEMPYGTEGGVQFQTDVLIQLGGFFETFGFELPRKQSKERMDHISNELAFMSYMCFRMAYGIQNDHDERKIGVLLNGMKKFILNHLGRWVPLFCIFASRKAERGLYKDMVDVLSCFIQNEITLLDVEPITAEEPDIDVIEKVKKEQAEYEKMKNESEKNLKNYRREKLIVEP